MGGQKSLVYLTFGSRRLHLTFRIR